MARTRNRKRKQVARTAKQQNSRCGSPSGWSLIGLWALTPILMWATRVSQRSQIAQKGYAHVPLLWIIVLLGLAVMTIVLTVQWYRVYRDRQS